jgi:hypothetical protein
MLRGGREFQEGTAVGFLLVWCGRHATTLVAAGHILNPLLSSSELDRLINKFPHKLTYDSYPDIGGYGKSSSLFTIGSLQKFIIIIKSYNFT